MLKNIKILILTCSIAQICTSEIQPAARASTLREAELEQTSLKKSDNRQAI